jgi:hypothetical protein
MDSPSASPFPSHKYTSDASHVASGQRKALLDLHALVTDGSEASIVGDDRLLTVTLPTRRTCLHSPMATQQNISAPRVASESMEAHLASQTVHSTNQQTLSTAENSYNDSSSAVAYMYFRFSHRWEGCLA